MSQITYYRADQYPLVVTVKNAATGSPIDITGYTFKLTVNSEKKPADDSNQIWQLDGDLDADPTTGRVVFDITDTQTDIPVRKYYYDIQMTTAGGDVRTIAKDVFEITMDITKN